MQSPIICLVTGGAGFRPLAAVIREAATSGVDLVQIREPSLDDRALLALTRQSVDQARGTACRIVVNDRVDIALAGDAAGVHLRGDSFSARRVRAVAPPGFLIGRSVHDAAQAAEAAADSGYDYLIFGTVFLSRNKPAGHPIAGLGVLRQVCASVQLPVIAIGGISVENAGEAMAAGAAGVAAIDLFRTAEPIASIVSRLRQRFDTRS